MEIPLTIFLALFGGAIILFLVLSFFLLYHAVRFGQVTPLNFFSMIAYAAVSVLLVISSARFVDAHDWSQTIDALVLVRTIFF